MKKVFILAPMVSERNMKELKASAEELKNNGYNAIGDSFTFGLAAELDPMSAYFALDTIVNELDAAYLMPGYETNPLNEIFLDLCKDARKEILTSDNIRKLKQNKNLIFISGPITGIKNYKDKFNEAEKYLQNNGFVNIINPAKVAEALPADAIKYEDFLKIDLQMLNACSMIYMLKGWDNSKGACKEHEYAINHGIDIIYQR